MIGLNISFDASCFIYKLKSMRAFKLLLPLSLLALLVATTETTRIDDYDGAELKELVVRQHGGDEATAMMYRQEQTGTATIYFNEAENTYREPVEIQGATLIGMIVGFGTTFTLILIGAGYIIADEMKRHEMYSALISRDLAKLQDECKYTSDQIQALEKEFLEAEARRGIKIDAKAAAQELQEIN